MRWIRLTAIVVATFAVGVIAGRQSRITTIQSVFAPASNPEEISVLDGDTLVVGKEVVRLAGIDAPELGPKAKCWAEAALAGLARQAVEDMVVGGNFRHALNGGWRVANPQGRDSHGHLIASLKRDDGEDLSDVLHVSGYAALSKSGSWDWCGPAKDLHAPDGPNLWYPTGKMYDERAFD